MSTKKVHLSNGINERINKLRSINSLNQKEFSEKLGISRSHLSEIESGKSLPSEMLLRLLCLTFNVNPNWLLTGEGEMFKAEPEAQEQDKIAHKITVIVRNMPPTYEA